MVQVYSIALMWFKVTASLAGTDVSHYWYIKYSVSGGLTLWNWVGLLHALQDA